MRVNLQTLGCRLNEAELETWAREFQISGHDIVTDAQIADIIVLNSCAVTLEAARKSRQLIRRARRDNPTAKVVLSGCFATLEAAMAASIIGVDMVVGNKDKDALVRIVHERFDLDHDSSARKAYEPEPALFSRGRQRAFIKVQDGCRYRCSFCVVTLARGQERSRPVEEIVREIKSLLQQGVQEAVLTGVHLGGYGHDLGTHLKSLIKSILEHTDLPRLRLGSLEPWDLPGSFPKLFDDPRMMPHLHLPLQSGCDKTLQKMARRCKTKDFHALATRLRNEIPTINISTDIIVGFPGETDEDWRESLDFIESLEFGDMHIFTYSPRDGTHAANMANQVPAELKRQRSQSMHLLARQMTESYQNRFIGKEFSVLWESKKLMYGKVEYCGYTPNYLRLAARVPESTTLDNRITNTRILGRVESSNFLQAEILTL